MSTQRKKTGETGEPWRNLDLLGKSSLKIHNILDSMEQTFLPVGSEIGKYRIIDEIDRGGMAVVYKALQLDLDRVVALKILPANITINRRFVERFLSEAHAVAKLNHPNIVSIYEVSMENNIYFLAMEYVAGRNLFHYLHQQKPKLVEVLEIFIALADALEYAHQQKIVHRDLKLNNVIMRDRNTPVLIDFGLAKTLEEEEGGITKTGEIIGSPAYMAPERIMGEATDSRSDICSLGIMLYEMLTFKNPYLDPRSIHQTTMNVIAADPVPPRRLVLWLPTEVEAITLKAMAKEAEGRYQTMAGFQDDIRRYQRGEQVAANPPSTWSKIVHYLRKHWAAVSIGAIVFAFTLLFVAVLYLQSTKERSHWQLVLHETFNDTTSLRDWYYWRDVHRGTPTGPAWLVADSALRVMTDAYTFMRFERPYTRDVKIEFDIRGLTPNLYNVGFFLCGSRPDSAYCFLIQPNGEATNGITHPGSSFLFSDYKPVDFTAKNRYHVEVEKADGVVTYTLDGVTVSRLHDTWPPLGKDHQNIGFFSDGCPVAIDNLKVYRRAVPLLARPTIIADRLFEHGSIKSSLEEYRELLLDISRRDMVRRIKFRIAECLIRLGDYHEARRVLDDDDLRELKGEVEQARRLYLRGMVHQGEGDKVMADTLFARLVSQSESSLFSNAVVSAAVLECMASLDSAKPEEAEERIMYLYGKYPKFSTLLSQAHYAVLRYYSKRGLTDRALEVGARIIKTYPRENDVLAYTRSSMGRIYLGKRKKSTATDILNQCIGAHYSSPGVWDAWMTLGEVYEFDRNFGDALSVYRKVYDECPRSMPVRWIAGIKIGEAAYGGTSAERPAGAFKDVAGGDHPFPEPRLVAQLYGGECDEETFSARWLRLRPGDDLYHYFLARKALMNDDRRTATSHLQALLAGLPQDSWRFVRVFSLKSGLDRM